MIRLSSGLARFATWIRAHEWQVRIVPTQEYADFEALRTINPNTRFQDRGERAALEVSRHKTTADPEAQAILLFEDSDILRRRFVLLLPERVTAISTGDFVHELEAPERIQSGDHILDKAAARRRNKSNGSQPPVNRRGYIARAIDASWPAARAGSGTRPLPMKAPVGACSGATTERHRTTKP